MKLFVATLTAAAFALSAAAPSFAAPTNLTTATASSMDVQAAKGKKKGKKKGMKKGMKKAPAAKK